MPPVEKFREQLLGFLLGPARNEWLVHPQHTYEVYVRAGYHYIDGAPRHTLDIANIAVHQARRGCGVGMSLIHAAEALNPFAAVYVENVLNERLAARLLKEGYTVVEGPHPPCFYKMKSQA